MTFNLTATIISLAWRHPRDHDLEVQPITASVIASLISISRWNRRSIKTTFLRSAGTSILEQIRWRHHWRPCLSSEAF